MITRTELKELASGTIDDNFYVSLYLNVDPPENRNKEWLLHFKNLTKDAISKFDQKQNLLFQDDIDQIENYLNDQPQGMKSGLAIISSSKNNYWNVYHSALTFPNLMVVDHIPYLKPLAVLVDNYSRYLVVVVGKTRARILLTSTGEIKEVTSIVKMPPDADSGRDGSTGDMGKLRAGRQRQQSYRLLHKDALNGLERIIAEENIKRVLIGGPDRGRAGFKAILPNHFREKIVGEFTIDRQAGNQDILDKIQPQMREIESEFERKAVDDLFNQTNRQVLGLSDVLTALQQGNVHKMYVISNATTTGMVCEQCKALTPDRDRPCPYCSSEMRPINHMLDLAIQSAYDQGSRVDMIDEEPRLEKAGGIGALLRY